MIILATCIVIFIAGIVLFKLNIHKNKVFAFSILGIGLLSVVSVTSIFVSEQLWVNSFTKYSQFYNAYKNIDYLPDYRDRALEFNEQLKSKQYDKALYGEWILISNKVFDFKTIPVYIPKN